MSIEASVINTNETSSIMLKMSISYHEDFGASCVTTSPDVVPTSEMSSWASKSFDTSDIGFAVQSEVGSRWAFVEGIV